jgi:hypothetical protein
MDTEPSSRREFEQAVGKAITNWQQVKEALCELFVVISTCDNAKIARAIYWSIRDFSEKLAIVRNTSRIALDGETLEYFMRLRGDLIKASELRNAIAHYHVIFYGIAPGHGSVIVSYNEEENADIAPHDARNNATLEIRLMPNILDPKTKFKPHGSSKADWLNTVRIRNASTRFLRLAGAIYLLKRNIPQTPKLP